MSENKIRVVKINSNNKVEVLDITNDLETFQGHVDGDIQAVGFSPSLTAWMDEEGKIKNKPVNLAATKVWEFYFGFSDVLAGDVLFTGGASADGDALSISDRDISMIRGILAGGN
jgi:hypothetical protein